MTNTAVIMNKGMRCLIEKLGIIETEIFVSHLLREPFDYTKWRKDNLYADMPLHELNQKAAQIRKGVFTGKRQLASKWTKSRRLHGPYCRIFLAFSVVCGLSGYF